jgi:predicted acyl esterase
MYSFVRFALSSALLVVAIGLLTASHGAAQETKQPDLASLFDKWEVMIPVRDGVKLHTEIYTPKGNKQSLPILFERWAYGFSGANKGFPPRLYGRAHLFNDGCIFAFQDIRGRFGSEGIFKMLRTTHDPSDPKGTDESTDAYDTIDWLIKNVPAWSKNPNGLRWHNLRFPRFSSNRFR